MIAITFTIVAVFAPVSFMGGIAGQYFKQFGLTVAAAVLISLLVARLITPMVAAYFLRPHEKTDREGLIMRMYTRLIGLDRPALLRHAGAGLRRFCSLNRQCVPAPLWLPPGGGYRALDFCDRACRRARSWAIRN